MLDSYIEEQKVVYRILKNAVIKNKCSHAYLFETNGYKDKEKIALAFAKYLLCPYSYSQNEKCVNCTQCENIDKNIFSELKIISPDGMWIKKEQLLELQKEFKTKSINANKKVYIITDATKLNISSSNTILKFLEEPEDNIIAILIADNIHKLLDTIVSRCQIVSFLKNNDSIETKVEKLSSLISVKVDEIEKKAENTIKFINYFEKNKYSSIINVKQMFFNNFIDRNAIIVALEIMLLYYKDIVNIKTNRCLDLFDDINMKHIAENNTLDIIYKKIKIISDSKENIYINANVNLLMDKLIIDLGGVK